MKRQCWMALLSGLALAVWVWPILGNPPPLPVCTGPVEGCCDRQTGADVTVMPARVPVVLMTNRLYGVIGFTYVGGTPVGLY
jgi:hypothetical protein